MVRCQGGNAGADPRFDQHGICFSEQFPCLFSVRHFPRQDGSLREIEECEGGKMKKHSKEMNSGPTK